MAGNDAGMASRSPASWLATGAASPFSGDVVGGVGWQDTTAASAMAGSAVSLARYDACRFTEFPRKQRRPSLPSFASISRLESERGEDSAARWP